MSQPQRPGRLIPRSARLPRPTRGAISPDTVFITLWIFSVLVFLGFWGVVAYIAKGW